MWLCRASGDLKIDRDFVKTAFGSATTEILLGDAKLSRFKTELAITADVWLEHGREALGEAFRSPDDEKPRWLKDMQENLETIRRGDAWLLLYLASNVPCHCLDSRGEESQKG